MCNSKWLHAVFPLQDPCLISYSDGKYAWNTQFYGVNWVFVAACLIFSDCKVIAHSLYPHQPAVFPKPHLWDVSQTGIPYYILYFISYILYIHYIVYIIYYSTQYSITKSNIIIWLHIFSLHGIQQECFKTHN